jgi:hypothetical protein
LILEEVAMAFFAPHRAPVQQAVLAILFLVAATAVSDAQSQAPMPAPNLNTVQPYTIPQSPEQSVSPGNPNTAPGSTLGSAGTNPITGQPCLGQGSTATTSGSTTIPGSGASGIIGSC